MGPPSKLLLLLTDDEPRKYAPDRFTPGTCCPCGVPDQCAPICTDDTSTDEYDITLAGITGGGEALNGTYRVRRTANCIWQYEFSPAVAGMTLLSMNFFFDGFFAQMSVQILGAGLAGGANWVQIDRTPGFSCAFTNEAFTFNFQNWGFQGVGSTCLVTAV